MRLGDICQQLFGLSLAVLWLSDRVSAFNLDGSHEIAISAVVAAIVLVIAVVVLIICCRRVNQRKKKRGRYHHVHNSSTLQSLYLSSKPTPEAIVANGYVNGKAKIGGGGGGNTPKKLSKSRSDPTDQRLYVVPEWRRQQDMRNGSYAAAVHRSPSNVSAMSGNIWTSNPTMTRGMLQSLTVVTSPTNNLHHDRKAFSSVPTIPDTSSSAVVSASNFEKSKSSKVRVEEDTKELLPTSSSEDMNGDRDHQVVARAYSNPAYVNDRDEREPTAVTSTSTSTGQESPFVAKVYSDYQLPRDYINSPRNDRADGHDVVAKAFSGSYVDANGATTGARKSGAELRRHESSPTRLAGVHVARAVVRHSSSLDSDGEPRYARPQDALNVGRTVAPPDGKADRAASGGGGLRAFAGKSGSFDVRRSSAELAESSDDIVYTPYGSNTRLISPTKHGNKRSKQNVLWRKDKSTSSADKFMDRRSGGRKKKSHGLVPKTSAEGDENGQAKPNGSDRPPNGVMTSSGGGASTGRRKSMERSDGSSVVEPISESSSTRGGAAVDDVVAIESVPQTTTTSVDDANAIYSAPIKKERVVARGRDEPRVTPLSPLTSATELRDELLSPPPPPLPPITKLRYEPLTPAPAAVTQPDEDSAAIAQPDEDSAAVAQPDEDSAAIAQPDENSAAVAQPDEDSAGIAQPDENSAAVTQLDENSAAMTVPEVTKQLDDPRTPLPSRSPVTKYGSANDGDGISTDLDFEFDFDLDKHSLYSVDDITAGRSVAKAFEFLETYTVTSRDDPEDNSSVITNATGREGKNVIGDAFKFLEDFDDVSLDAEDRL